MKTYYYILIFLTAGSRLNSQTQTNSILANLIKLSDTSIAVDFVVGPSANLSGTGNPISVFLRIPTSATPNDSTITLDSSNFGLVLAQASDDEAGYFIYYFEGPAVDLNSPAWDNGVTTRVGVFHINGSPGSIQLVGGQYGPAVPNGSGGFSWPGTALLTNNTETNLVSWPINENLSLPLRLGEFNLTKTGQVAQLKWTTLSEMNTSHFEIQRSRDNITWLTLGQVAAAGHSSIARNYTYQDQLALSQPKPSGNYYYRIKTIDLDQAFNYSAVKHIQIGTGAQINLINTLVRDRLYLQYQDMNDRSIEFKIVDIQGKVYQVNKISLDGTSGTVEFSKGINALPAGVYHLLSPNPGFSQGTIRFVKTGI